MEIASQNAKQKAAVRGKTGEQRPTKQAEGAAKLIVDFMRKLKPSDFRSDYGKYKDFTDQGWIFYYVKSLKSCSDEECGDY